MPDGITTGRHFDMGCDAAAGAHSDSCRRNVTTLTACCSRSCACSARQRWCSACSAVDCDSVESVERVSKALDAADGALRTHEEPRLWRRHQRLKKVHKLRLKDVECSLLVRQDALAEAGDGNVAQEAKLSRSRCSGAAGLAVEELLQRGNLGISG